MSGPHVAAQDQRMSPINDPRDFGPLDFYAYIVRNLGLPARFYWDESAKEWVGEAPFTKPVPQSILDLLEAQGV